jgi:hypothetical protein
MRSPGTKFSAWPPSSLPLIGLLMIGGCLTSACVLSAEAELADVEVASKGIAIPAAPAEADSDDTSVTVQFRQKPNRAGLAKDSFQDVRVLGLSLVANSGITDLGFLRTLHVTATTKEATAAGKKPVEIVRYTRAAAGKPGVDAGATVASVAPVGPTLAIAADPPADITELWRGAEMEFTLAVAGRLPPVAWTADVGLRIGATLSY